MQLLYALAELRTPFLDALLGALTNCGGELVFMAAAIIVFWCVSKSCGYYMLPVGFVGTIVNQFLKLLYIIRFAVSKALYKRREILMIMILPRSRYSCHCPAVK